jgi:type I restriction enzyme R subunit
MLDDEQQRAMREGLDEDTLALFDLLVKPDLNKDDIRRLKAVAVGLYETLMTQVRSMQDFATKQATRDRMRLAIRDYLWSDGTGLPPSYAEPEVEARSEAVFAHLMMKSASSVRSKVTT